MKFVYATDLHGDIRKYHDVVDFANEHGVKLIHLGADLLPKGAGILKEQKKFVKGFLQNFYTECRSNGIEVLAFWGNDDIYTRKKYFREFADLLDEEPRSIEGYEFKAYGYVPDYPFGLKTACKLDYKGWYPSQRYIGRPVDVNEKGFYNINNKDIYFERKGTIEEDLSKVAGGPKTVMAIHCPPQAMGMDVCADWSRVGSMSVSKWIDREKPILVLCGHIHESPRMTGVWKNEVSGTMIIQPGQEKEKTTAVLVEIKNGKVYAQKNSL